MSNTKIEIEIEIEELYLLINGLESIIYDDITKLGHPRISQMRIALRDRLRNEQDKMNGYI